MKPNDDVNFHLHQRCCSKKHFPFPSHPSTGFLHAWSADPPSGSFLVNFATSSPIEHLLESPRMQFQLLVKTWSMTFTKFYDSPCLKNRLPVEFNGFGSFVARFFGDYTTSRTISSPGMLTFGVNFVSEPSDPPWNLIFSVWISSTYRQYLGERNTYLLPAVHCLKCMKVYRWFRFWTGWSKCH